jgi:hypothetical protein
MKRWNELKTTKKHNTMAKWMHGEMNAWRNECMAKW